MVHEIGHDLALVRQDIEVPETILKKRKQNEKAREEKLAAAAAARKVRSTNEHQITQPLLYYDAYQTFG